MLRKKLNQMLLHLQFGSSGLTASSTDGHSANSMKTSCSVKSESTILILSKRQAILNSYFCITAGI